MSSVNEMWVEYDKLETQLNQLADSCGISSQLLKREASQYGHSTYFRVISIIESQLKILIKIKTDEIKSVCNEPLVDLSYYRHLSHG